MFRVTSFSRAHNGSRHIVTAEDVEEARSHIPDCDLVLSDIRIGTENGIEFLEELWGQGVDKPMLLMSGITKISENEKAIELTGYPVLSKPVNFEEVLGIVGKIFSR